MAAHSGGDICLQHNAEPHDRGAAVLGDVCVAAVVGYKRGSDFRRGGARAARGDWRVASCGAEGVDFGVRAKEKAAHAIEELAVAGTYAGMYAHEVLDAVATFESLIVAG